MKQTITRKKEAQASEPTVLRDTTLVQQILFTSECNAMNKILKECCSPINKLFEYTTCFRVFEGTLTRFSPHFARLSRLF